MKHITNDKVLLEEPTENIERIQLNGIEPSLRKSSPLIPVTVCCCGIDDVYAPRYMELKDRLKEALRAVKEKLPYTPLYIMSTLYTKSDRITAEAALNEGYKLIFVLPCDIKKYRREFSGGDAYAFEHLYSRAERTVLATEHERVKKSLFDRTDNGRLNASVYMLRRSSLLLALYDGRETNAKGDTAWLINAMLKKEELSKEAFNTDTGGVITINTPSEKNPYIEKPFEVSFRCNNEKELLKTLSDINRFNGEASAEQAMRSASAANAQKAEKAAPDNEYGQYALSANALCEKHEKKYLRRINALSASVFIALCCLTAFALFKFLSAIALCAAFTAVSFILYTNIKKTKHKSLAGEYGLFAEASALMDGLANAGTEFDITDALTYSQKKSVPWIYASLHVPSEDTEKTDAQVKDGFDAEYIKTFLADKEEYCRERVQKLRGKMRAQSITTIIANILAAVLLAALVAVAAAYPSYVPYLTNRLGGYYVVMLAPYVELAFGAVASLALILNVRAVLLPYSKKKLYEEKLFELYSKSCKELEANEACEIFITAAVNSLAETASFYGF